MPPFLVLVVAMQSRVSIFLVMAALLVVTFVTSLPVEPDVSRETAPVTSRDLALVEPVLSTDKKPVISHDVVPVLSTDIEPVGSGDESRHVDPVASYDEDPATLHNSDPMTSPAPPARQANLGQIEGGRDSAANAHRYMVSLWRDSNHHCGGALIGPGWVLTAAHCVDTIKSPSVLTIIAGENNLTNWRHTAIYSKVDDFVFHSGWNRKELLHDIALVKLTNPLYDENRIAYAPLAKNDDFDNKTCLFMGFGYISSDSKRGHKSLQETYMDLTAPEACAKVYGNYFSKNLTQLCALSDSATDATAAHTATCKGDSGGPVMCGRGSRYLTGLVSFGNGECNKRGYPDVYTRVSAYIDWITWNQFILALKPLSTKCRYQ